MINIKNISPFLFSFFLALPLFAQLQQAPEWTVSSSKEDLKPGEETALIFKAEIPEGWYLYSSDFDPELGPMLTEFEFKEHAYYELVGAIEPVGQKKKYDELWEGEYTYFTGTAEFRQKVRILQETPVMQGTISYQICSDESGQCIPLDADFSYGAAAKSAGQESTATAASNASSLQDKLDLSRKAGQGNEQNARVEQEAAAGDIPVLELEPFTTTVDVNASTEEEESGWNAWLTFFLISFGAGFAALLTPCVFPMIPMTVTYFTKTSTSRAKGISNALIYGLSIIVIYTLRGI